MKARVITRIKPAILDPQGKAIESALQSMGIEGFTRIRQGRLYDIEMEGDDPVAVEAQLKDAVEKMLVSVTMEDYEIIIEKGGSSPESPPIVDQAVPGAVSREPE